MEIGSRILSGVRSSAVGTGDIDQREISAIVSAEHMNMEDQVFTFGPSGKDEPRCSPTPD
jgi:hypothetical protein